jgi:probable HAF family extracellular repeat protein
MKKHSVWMRFVLVCACLITPLCGWAAKDTFTATFVDRPYGENSFFGIAINNSGAIVGTVQSPEFKYWYTGPNGKGVFYPESDTIYCPVSCSIGDINDQGQVAGSWRFASDLRAYVTAPNGRLIDIHPAAAAESYATSINNRGQVAGGADAGGQRWVFTSNRQNDRLLRLPTLGSDSYATAMNDRGVVAGCSTDAAGNDHAFVTGPNGRGINYLGVLRPGDSSCVNEVNAKGQAVGYSLQRGIGDPRAFISTADGLGMVDLSQIGNARGFNGSAVAYGINRQGHVVGYGEDSTRGGQYAPFITGRNGVNMRNLNDLVTVPIEYKIRSAKAINDRGQILTEIVQDYPSLMLLTPTRPTWADELDDE